MSSVEQVRILSRWLEGTDIALLEWTRGGETITLRRDPVRPAVPPCHAQGETVGAPSAGVFRAAHPARAGALARPGQRVREADPLAVLQVGALLIHVSAPVAGTVQAVLAEDGAVVGYGTPLFRLMKAAAP